jgi:SAM-dependent methyltransferase
MANLRSITKRTILAYTAGSEEYLKQWNRRAYRVPPLLSIFMQQVSPRSLVLDMGCGPGQDSRYLRQQGMQVVGLDLMQPFLRVAKRRSPRLPLVQATMEHLPFLPNSVSGIWAAASLIHLPPTTLQQVLREARLRTRSGGVLGATFLHGKGAGFLPDQWIPGRYVCKWRKPELGEIIQRAGWKIISLQTVTNRERKGRWLNVIARRET